MKKDSEKKKNIKKPAIVNQLDGKDAFTFYKAKKQKNSK